MPTDYGMRDYKRPLKADKEEQIVVSGDYFHVVSALAAVQLQFDDGDWITRQVTMGMPVAPYRKVRIRSAVDQTVNIALGFTGGGTTPLDGRATMASEVPNASDMPTERPTEPDLVVAAGDTVQVLPDDPARISALIQVDADAVGLVRVGDSAVGPAQGLKVYPDDAAVARGRAEVWVHNPQASPVSLSIIKENI